MRKNRLLRCLSATLLCAVFLLPACGTGSRAYTVTYTAGEGGTLVGECEQKVPRRKDAEQVTAVADAGYRFVGWDDGVSEAVRTDTGIVANAAYTAVFEPEYLDLPAIRIDTEENAAIVSKEDYVNCGVSVLNADEAYNFSGASAKIRGRGNSSWFNMPKKSYKLKFSEKTDLFGNGKAKTWTLIANYCDPSLARNYFALSLGAQFPSLQQTTSTTQFVDLYLNGRYDGVYLVCAQNEVGKTRVDIDEDVDDVDTGYLLEMDVRIEGEELIDYFALEDYRFGRKCYQLKSPDPEDIADAGKYPQSFISYIGLYTSDCLNAIVFEDFERVCDLIDVDSFAESYIVNELFNAQDVGDSSFFLYKKKGGKLYCGPIWDYDISTGNCNYYSSFYTEHGSWEYDCLWAKELNVWYYYLTGRSEFCEIVGRKLAEYETKIRETIDACAQSLYANERTFVRNFKRWDVLGKPNWPNPIELQQIKTWKNHVKYVRNWLLASLEFVKSQYPI